MKWISTSTFRQSVILSFALGVAMASTPAGATQGDCGGERNVRVHALDELTWRQLSRIDRQIDEKEYGPARQELEQLLTRAERDPYLRAIIYQALGQVAWAREDYPEALADFSRALDLDILPDDTHFALMYQVAQLYYLQEQDAEALAALDQWLCRPDAGENLASAWVLKASIHSRRNQYAEALAAIENAIAVDRQPHEQWYQLKLAAQFELEQYPAAESTLESMIGIWPEQKAYWIQLSQVSYRLKQTGKALAVMALAHRRDLLDRQEDLIWLSDLYSLSDIPFKAAAILQRGIQDGVVEATQKNWQAVADAWYRAEELELALRAYRRAGEKAKNGEVDLRRSYILVDLERWEDALTALDQALAKGGLGSRRTAEAFLLRGVAHFNLSQFDRARSDWVMASRDDGSRKAAEQWLNHLREERRRRAS